MHDHLAMLLDGGFSEHWPDLLLAALISTIGGLFGIVVWFLKRDISGFEKRHERAEDKFEEHGKTLNGHETRLTVLEEAKPQRNR